PGATILRRCSIGVCPTSSVMSSATRKEDLDRVGTLQGTTASGDLVIRSSGEMKIWPSGSESQSVVFADEIAMSTFRSPDDPITRSPDHEITRLLSSASRSSLLLSGIVAAAGADGELLVLSGASVNVNRSKAADIFGRRGCVSNGVLVSDIVGNASADVIHFG